jgi:hypothetical protein
LLLVVVAVHLKEVAEVLAVVVLGVSVLVLA